MSGSIVRVPSWNYGSEQQFLAVNPVGDEVILYETQHTNPNEESNEMLRLNSRGGFENIQCSSYSPNYNGIVGIGAVDGTISIFDLKSEGSSLLSLGPKQKRPCNSISFNGSNLLVAGFDKGRQDSSLKVWNIEHYSRTSNSDHIKRPIHSHLPNEAILCTTFYPHEESNVLCGSYKFLREVDLRLDAPSFQMATKCTLGVTVDPFSNHLFSSYSEDGSVAVWDRRKLTSNTTKTKSLSTSNVITETPILYFNKLLSDPSSRKNISTVFRYSPIRNGEFSSIFNGELLRRWNTGTVPASNYNFKDSKLKPMKATSTLESLKIQSSQLYKPSEESLFVSLVLDTKTDYERVLSFDYSEDILSPMSTHFVCMRQSGSVFRMPVIESIETLDFNSFNDFTFSGVEETVTQFASQEETFADQISNNGVDTGVGKIVSRRISEAVESSTDDGDGSLTQEQNQYERTINDQDEDEDFVPFSTYLDSFDIIKNDICAIIRRRAVLGYSLDISLNVELLDRLDALEVSPSLVGTWKWLGLAKKALDKGTMISRGLDLGFMGVMGIWKGVEGLQDQKRSLKESGAPTEKIFYNAVNSIVAFKENKSSRIAISTNSEKRAQRKLALLVSGLYFSDEELEEKLNMLISLGYVEKAAGWAVFYGDVLRAVHILGDSNKDRLRLMSTAVAGYLAYNDSTVNSPWKDQCRKMASELANPYLRAIFAFIADNDWWDVLDENALPLRERLGIALRFLSDKDLTVYLNRLCDSVVHKGELEGLILTGVTPRGMDLLQSYVNRTSDVQTASLISSFGCPRYFIDERVSNWIDNYRGLLNSWQLFSIRAKFDVSRTKLSKTFSGQLSLKASPKQVYLQCIRCNKNLSKFKSVGTKTNSMNPSVIMKQFNKLNMNGKEQDVKACPHCGSPLPRCSICLLSLGTPLSYDVGDKNSKTTVQSRIERKFNESFSFCLSCNHAAHAIHSEEWFAKHYVCPVPDCNCRCSSK